MSTLQEIHQFLLTGSIVTQIYETQAPDVPDDVLYLMEYGGQPAEYVFDGVAYVNPRVQVISRSMSYVTAESVARAVFNLLAVVKNTVITSVPLATSSARYHSITPLQEPFLFRRDVKTRVEIACNYAILKDVS